MIVVQANETITKWDIGWLCKHQKNNHTTTQSDILQAKAQTIAQTLDKQVIVATQGKQQHVKVKSGYLYEISLKEGEVLNADANLIVKKQGSDLQVLLEHNTTVIFDGYLAICTSDLSCLLSLPSAQGAYYIAENSFTPPANGSQIVYFYGDETALLDIAKGQSGSFEQSFNEVFLYDVVDLHDDVETLSSIITSGLAGIPIGLAGSGGTNPPVDEIWFEIITPADDGSVLW